MLYYKVNSILIYSNISMYTHNTFYSTVQYPFSCIQGLEESGPIVG